MHAIDVVEVLERITQEHGFPKRIKVDNGPEFISKDLDHWAYWNKVELDFSRPGKPSDNALVEAFTVQQRRKRREQRPTGSFLLRPDGTFRQPNALDLTIGYGDARGEAAGLIEKELAANPRSIHALKARAQLRRMQGLGE